MRCKEYKVMRIVESGLGTIFLGAAAVPLKKMEAALNKELTNGWHVVFQIIEQKRFMLFWKREAVIITLGR
jgi:CHASE3 domain sensor protein